MRYEDWPARTFLIKNPCVYREHDDDFRMRIQAAGLSLCIQGTPNKNRLFGGWPRFIPVHTGNTNCSNPWRSFSTVYPCVYREHAIKLGIEDVPCGLSLCIQGTRPVCGSSAIEYRFIPVHTGNTRADPRVERTTSVYPCAYREHADTPMQHFQAARFIPVHTGNTNNPNISCTLKPVYPCAYREHWLLDCSSMSDVGLSLCIQGTSSGLKSITSFNRFIPVHTGNIF